jgi:hypothetical protein
MRPFIVGMLVGVVLGLTAVAGAHDWNDGLPNEVWFQDEWDVDNMKAGGTTNQKQLGIGIDTDNYNSNVVNRIQDAVDNWDGIPFSAFDYKWFTDPSGENLEFDCTDRQAQPNPNNEKVHNSVLKAIELGDDWGVTGQCIRDITPGADEDWVMDGFFVTFDTTPRSNHTGSYVDHPWHNLNSAGSGHVVDREAVATHEVGHGLGFDHFQSTDTGTCTSGVGATSVATMCEGTPWHELDRKLDGGTHERTPATHDEHTMTDVYANGNQ